MEKKLSEVKKRSRNPPFFIRESKYFLVLKDDGLRYLKVK
jgi:hypothetical protein